MSNVTAAAAVIEFSSRATSECRRVRVFDRGYSDDDAVVLYTVYNMYPIAGYYDDRTDTQLALVRT